MAGRCLPTPVAEQRPKPFATPQEVSGEPDKRPEVGRYSMKHRFTVVEKAIDPSLDKVN